MSLDFAYCVFNHAKKIFKNIYVVKYTKFSMALVTESWFKRLFPLKSYKEFTLAIFQGLYHFTFLYLNINLFAVYPGIE